MRDQLSGIADPERGHHDEEESEGEHAEEWSPNSSFASAEDDTAQNGGGHGKYGQVEADAAKHGRLRHSLWTGDPGFAIYLWDCIRGGADFPTLDVFYA